MSNVAIVQGIYAAFGRGDIPAILERLANNVAWRINMPASVPYAGDTHGPDGVARWFATLVTAAEFTRFVPDTFIDGGEHVVVLGHEEGRARGTGRTWSTAWVHVWTLRDSHVASFQEFADSAAVTAAFA
jgi:ketosteroid isomerase-like protein